ncbi:MAG: hypothetical protein KDK61_01175 [Simkania sp.]|nr:hypothetical protein [Chlamydiia bacterium]MCB1082897.1 hypothetical protein [Simkania sp.]
MKQTFSFFLFCIMFLLSLLSGCGIYNNGFECKPGRGVGCVSSWEVNDMILEKQSRDPEPFDQTEYIFDPEHRNKEKRQ